MGMHAAEINMKALQQPALLIVFPPLGPVKTHRSPSIRLAQLQETSPFS